MMWFIAAILVTVPSVTSACGGAITLTDSNSKAAFKTPYYPGLHEAQESCTWTVSSPSDVTELKLHCDLDIYPESGCESVSFSYLNNDKKVIACGTGTLSKTLAGSTNTFTFKSSLFFNAIYKGVSCTVSYEPQVAPITMPPIDPSCTCGQRGGQRVVGGNEATPNEHPWQVLVMYKSSKVAFCGGSIISREWVLSASHCFSPTTIPSGLLLGLGEHDQSTSDSISQDYDVTQVIMHENYNKPRKLNNDIALLKVAKPITFNQYISPICLPFHYKNYDFKDKTGTTSGWGLTVPGDDDSASKVLKEIDVKLIMGNTCNYKHGNGWVPGMVNENMICGMAKDGGGACQGDSGGPLVWKSLSANHYFQVGIVSFGARCGSTIFPTVFTYVPKLIDWIIEKTGAGKEFCSKQ